MSDNTIDIKGGNNQILPNADKAVQNIYYGDSAIKRPLSRLIMSSPSAPRNL